MMKMREILFRGKRTDNGEWVQGFYVVLGGENHCIFTGRLDITRGSIGFEYFKVDPKTVGQFTGLTDKNGNKIFEGDIVSYFNNDILNSEIIYKDGCFMLRFISERTQKIWQSKQKLFFDFPNASETTICGEVIGNIHDTPELLKGTKSNDR